MIARKFMFIFFFLALRVANQEDYCNLECFEFQRTKCKICYEKCRQNDQQANVFKSCQQISQRQPIYLNNKVKMTSFLTQKQCLLKCCYNSESQLFLKQSYDQCIEANDKQAKRVKQQYDSTYIGRCFNYPVICSLGIVLLCCVASLILGFIGIFTCFYLYQSYQKHCKQGFFKTMLKNFNQILRAINNYVNKYSQNNDGEEIVSESCDLETVKKMKWKFFFDIDNENLLGNMNNLNNSQFSNKNQKCSICKNTEVNCQTKCGHNFHILCLQNQINNDLTCPQCEAELNPLRVFCENCYKKESIFIMQVQNKDLQKMLNKQKINCTQCVNKIIAAGTYEKQPI